jgi:hypothetical protein
LVLTLPGCQSDESKEVGVPVPWLRATPSPDGRVLKIGYESDPCTRARKARVEVEDRVITVTLFNPMRDPEQACIAIVRPACVTVQLTDPVGSRRLVDGAPNRFPQTEREAERLPFSRYGRCVPVQVDR